MNSQSPHCPLNQKGTQEWPGGGTVWTDSAKFFSAMKE